MKIRPVGAELFYGYGQTDRHVTKIIGAFSQFCEKASKKESLVHSQLAPFRPGCRPI